MTNATTGGGCTKAFSNGSLLEREHVVAVVDTVVDSGCHIRLHQDTKEALL